MSPRRTQYSPISPLSHRFDSAGHDTGSRYSPRSLHATDTQGELDRDQVLIKCKSVIEALHSELEEEKLRYTELQQANKQAQSEVSILRAEIDAEKKKRKEIQSESNKLQSMSSDHDLKLQVIEKQRLNLERNLDQIKQDYRRSREELTQKQIKIDELEHLIKGLQYKYTHETEQLRKEIADISGKLIHAEDEKGRLRLSLDKLLADSERAVRRLAEETELRNSRSDAKAEEDRNGRIRAEAEVRELKQSLKSIEAEIIRRAEVHSQKEVSLERETAVKLQIAAEEVQTLNSQVHKLRGHTVAAEASARDAADRASAAVLRENAAKDEALKLREGTALADERTEIAERRSNDTAKQLVEFRSRLERTTADFGRAISKIEELQQANLKAGDTIRSREQELANLSEELIKSKMHPVGWDEERVARLRTKYEAKILKLRQKLVEYEERQANRQQNTDFSALSGGDEAWRRIVKEEVQAVARALMAPRN